MPLKNIGRQTEFWIHQIGRYIMYIGIVVLFFMMLIQTIDVIGRYVFNSPLKASMDYIELSMSIVIFWGLAYCASTNEHVSVDLITVRLSRRTQEILIRLSSLGGTFIMALITWRLALRAWSYLQNPPGPVTLTMLVPYWPFIVIAAIGSLFLCLEYLIRIFNPSAGKQKVHISELESAGKQKVHISELE